VRQVSGKTREIADLLPNFSQAAEKFDGAPDLGWRSALFSPAALAEEVKLRVARKNLAAAC
jgi:hypothetical protein